MTKTPSNASIIIEVMSKKGSHTLETVAVRDCESGEEWDRARIAERGIERFLDLSDMKETLNWNLNCDDQRYAFKWAMNGKTASRGIAYLYR